MSSTDLMSHLPAPRPVSNIDTRVNRPATVEISRILKVLDRHAQDAAATLALHESDPEGVWYREALAVREALRELTLDILSTL